MAIEILKALQVKQARDGEFSDGGSAAACQKGRGKLCLPLYRAALGALSRLGGPSAIGRIGGFTTKGDERTTRELRPACLPTSCDICNYVRMFATILSTY